MPSMRYRPSGSGCFGTLCPKAGLSMDPNWVVNHAYNVASYILANDNPIEDGETVDGVEDGQMSRDVQWKCRYEDALIQPPRAVLDINMGEYAAGNRD